MECQSYALQNSLDKSGKDDYRETGHDPPTY